MFLFSATNLIKTIFPQTAASDKETVTGTRLLKAKPNKTTIKTKPTRQTEATERWLSGPLWRRQWQAAQWALLFAFAPSGEFPGSYTQEELSRFPESRIWRWISGEDQETRIRFARCSSAEQRAARRENLVALGVLTQGLSGWPVWDYSSKRTKVALSHATNSAFSTIHTGNPPGLHNIRICKISFKYEECFLLALKTCQEAYSPNSSE